MSFKGNRAPFTDSSRKRVHLDDPTRGESTLCGRWSATEIVARRGREDDADCAMCLRVRDARARPKSVAGQLAPFVESAVSTTRSRARSGYGLVLYLKDSADPHGIRIYRPRPATWEALFDAGVLEEDQSTYNKHETYSKRTEKAGPVQDLAGRKL